MKLLQWRTQIVMICQTRTRTVMLPNSGAFTNSTNTSNLSKSLLEPLIGLSSTLLDHFATNKPNFITYSGSRTIGFCDHDLIFGMRKISCGMHKEPKIINCRYNRHYTPELFRKALSEASWEYILSAEDPNTMSEKWLDQFTEILDQIAPFKQWKVKNSYAPFIDKELKHKMLQRDLYKVTH